VIPRYFLEAFALLGEAFPSWKPNERTVEVWYSLLKDLPPKVLRRAAIRHAQTSKYPPTIAALRELACEKIPFSSEEAWMLVRRRLAEETFSKVGIPENALEALRAIGGSMALRNANSSDMGALRAHFMRCYDALAHREKNTREIETLKSFDEDDARELDRQEIRQLEGSL